MPRWALPIVSFIGTLRAPLTHSRGQGMIPAGIPNESENSAAGIKWVEMLLAGWLSAVIVVLLAWPWIARQMLPQKE